MDTAPDAPETGAADWRSLDRAALSRAYDNSGAVPGSAETVAAWRAQSAAFREARLDAERAYGPGPRQRLDLYRCGAPSAPLLAFIHGGYWQRNAKEGFSCMAAGPLALGLDVAMIGYTLAPEASLSEIAAEIRAALRLLRSESRGRRLVVSGWSAGGHLAALAADAADAGLAISGIFELAPIARTGLDDALRLSAEEIAALSPIRHLAPGGPPVSVVYGAEELPELRRQSTAYHAARVAAGLAGPLLAVPGAQHFSVLDGLMRPDGGIAREAARLAAL
ncbi:alpha/beta hydrolase [Methylobacterium planeticum]|uniref:Alpha/beta hydrolase fold domain-containing protein n=1 Tax=Methylobacterium planeticum TaxID=2615211 RepID=A0A6N6MUL9_9HYPH|nr:alpha/beta hydrolase fold domain-containing protein [Methylobacterium planeticum]KAB1074306.1 alpha/beta hydrolase fold domain-containing protein [Methylobacterium planeticum]